MKHNQVTMYKTRYVLASLLLGLVMLCGHAPAQAQSGGFAYVSNGGLSSVFGYNINPDTGALTAVPGSPFPTNGASSREIAVDPTGQFAYVANAGIPNPFGGLPASVSAFRINPVTGALTLIGAPLLTGDGASGAQGVTVDPTGQFVYVSGQGSGKIYAYTINPATGALTPIPGQPFASGAGARSMAIDPSGSFAYVANAGGGLFSPGQITAFTINPDTGALAPIPGSPFAVGQSPWAVTIDPSGRYLYAANSIGSGSVLAFNINGVTGGLTQIAGSPFPAGINPQGITVDPYGQFVYVANRGALFSPSNTVSAYTINPSTGALTQVAGSPFAVGPAGSSPSSVITDPGGSFLYVATWTDNSVRPLYIDSVTGALTVPDGSPSYPAGVGPWSVTTTWGSLPPAGGHAEK